MTNKKCPTVKKVQGERRQEQRAVREAMQRGDYAAAKAHQDWTESLNRWLAGHAKYGECC